jgi:hypothetical protein
MQLALRGASLLSAEHVARPVDDAEQELDGGGGGEDRDHCGVPRSSEANSTGVLPSA